MVRIGTRTKLTPEEVVRRAVRFFGPAGRYGLEVTGETGVSACFEGGGGRVEVTACAEEDGRRTQVDVVAREWEEAAKQFITSL